MRAQPTWIQTCSWVDGCLSLSPTLPSLEQSHWRVGSFTTMKHDSRSLRGFFFPSSLVLLPLPLPIVQCTGNSTLPLYGSRYCHGFNSSTETPVQPGHFRFPSDLWAFDVLVMLITSFLYGVIAAVELLRTNNEMVLSLS